MRFTRQSVVHIVAWSQILCNKMFPPVPQLPPTLAESIPLVCNYPNRLACVIFYYISLSYARGGIVRTFKGSMHVRSKVVRTYVQGVPGRTSKGPLNDGERKLKRNEWDMV